MTNPKTPDEIIKAIIAGNRVQIDKATIDALLHGQGGIQTTAYGQFRHVPFEVFRAGPDDVIDGEFKMVSR